MHNFLKVILLVLFITITVYTQNTIMSYNILNYPGTDTTVRNPHFRTILGSVNPDILVVQEIQSQAGVNGFLNNILNTASSGYAAGTFIDGLDSDNAIFFKSSLFSFISNIRIDTELRDINEFTLRHTASGDTIRIYSVHLKASNTSEDEQQRAREVDSLRKRTNALPPESNFIVLGDFNIYSGTESAYQKLLNTSAAGYVIDPFTLTNPWNSSSNAQYHTQSPRVRAFGGGSIGGMDDRFDMILYSQGVANPGGITYIPGSYNEYGNDGNHYNDSINRPPNTAVSQAVADAIHNASDHLPVIAQFNFQIEQYMLSSFTALIEGLYNGSVMTPDTVTVELRSTSSPYPLISQSKVLLDANGTGNCSFSGVTNGVPYYLVLKHRNGLETWSSSGQVFSSYNMSYDFTAASGRAYGNNLKLIGGKWCIYSGDTNQDGLINSSDLNQVYSSNVSGNQGYSQTDLNGDLFTEIEDINIVFRNSVMGASRQVPP